MENIKKLKSWHLAAAGAGLILVSTIFTGYWIYKIQNNIDECRRNILEKEYLIDKSSRSRDFASLLVSINTMQSRITIFLPDAYDRLRPYYDNILAASLMEANFHMAAAANMEKDQKVVADINKAFFKASKGDGVVDSLEVMRYLLNENMTYQSNIRKDVALYKTDLSAKEKSKGRIYFAAFTLQIIGLIILLLKETITKGNK